MATYTFNLPDIGEGIAEAEIVAWHVKVGDRIEEDGRIADMMTDKATVEMESPVSGVIRKVAGAEGDVIAIGSMLVEIETEGEDAPVVESAPAPEVIEAETPKAPPVEAAAPAPAPSAAPVAPKAASGDGPLPSQGSESGEKVLASPVVRQRARDLGIDLAKVRPAEGNRIRHADLDAYLNYGGTRAGPGRAADEEIRVIGMRKRIAQNMAESKRHIPHFTYVEEIDVTKMEEMRAEMNESRGSRPKLTALPILIAAICKTLREYPMLNARYDDEANVVTRFGAVHLGIATQTDAGLMVPVLRGAESLSVWDMASEIARLADAARSGKAKSEELSGSTLTLTSLGPLGGIATTPVINRPEVAIIGPNKIVERPMVVDGAVIIRKMMNLSISCDHRVVDGYDAASFVQALKRRIETPIYIFAD
ncbi:MULTISPECIES: dihydrolipoamide acetyltransferase family protein [Pseudomonadota]|jgi:2-oxoisovalerate dehydrogenase E2 component (dihydrolipoyl transacylase)|uniref:dihydrolipoamide acetyltransferase family protein n=1 Tax=Pseudomonadota TaxID=1224 RepID=UPI00076AA217|nr:MULTISPECIES: dihydrolipoamide acetyltransferase family protein [Pseudomonadota]MAF62690.1 2-oxo acid dehydrogenase subunit E2 [Blastomonas sp.]|tara:strand:+ start:32469 stop:33734 length:1266 start_codon:yes stop_codon:yes gene_type:complete